jgi:lysozyme family protein
MKLSIEDIHLIVDEIIEREGGFVDHPDDRGGPTNFGVTMKALSAWRGYEVSRADIANLSRKEALGLLTHRYVLMPGIYALGFRGVVRCVADMSVHHGPTRAIKMLQRAVAVQEDGIMGPTTRGAADNMRADLLVDRLVKIRCIRFVRIVEHTPSQIAFLEGWISRALSFID